MVSRQDFPQGLFDVPVRLKSFLEGLEPGLDGFPVIGLLGSDVDAVMLGGLVVLLVQEELLIELLPGPQAGVNDFFPSGAVKADHLLGKVPDLYRLAHIQDEEFAALRD